MTLLLAFLLVVLTAVLAARMRPTPLYLLLLGLAGVGVGLGVRLDALAPALLPLGFLLAPRLPRVRPRSRKAAPASRPRRGRTSTAEEAILSQRYEILEKVGVGGWPRSTRPRRRRRAGSWP